MIGSTMADKSLTNAPSYIPRALCADCLARGFGLLSNKPTGTAKLMDTVLNTQTKFPLFSLPNILSVSNAVASAVLNGDLLECKHPSSANSLSLKSS